jgi:signal transduction histidine kinase
VEELREAVEARDAFIAVAAHELRNPMFALGLLVEESLRAADREGAARTAERLRLVRAALQGYVERATTILDVSRVNSGRVSLDIEEVDLAEIARQVVETQTPHARLNEAPLTLDAPDGLRGRLDRLAVEQILSNLVTNAIKYGAGAPIDVAVRREGQEACISVRDRGIGIAPEDLGRMFERFERVVTHGRHVGFGIGLWLVRRLVEAHGGSLSAGSEPGRGSTFTVRLPLDATSAGPRPP